MGTAVKYPVMDQVKPSFVIFDIRTLCCQGLSVRVPKSVKNYKWCLLCQAVGHTIQLFMIHRSNIVNVGNVYVKGYPTYKEKVKTRPGGKHEGMYFFCVVYCLLCRLLIWKTVCILVNDLRKITLCYIVCYVDCWFERLFASLWMTWGKLHFLCEFTWARLHILSYFGDSIFYRSDEGEGGWLVIEIAGRPNLWAAQMIMQL